MDKTWLVLGVILAMCATDICAVQMKINPKSASTQEGGNVLIMCDMKLLATDCVFHVSYSDYNVITKAETLKPLKLEKGNASVTFQRPDGSSTPLFQASYHGDGLAHGQCGVKLFDLKPGAYFVGCRVRNENTGWAYDYMALVVQNNTGSSSGALKSSYETDFEMVYVKERENSRKIDFSLNLRSNWECKLVLPKGDLLAPKALLRKEQVDNYRKAKWKATVSSVSVTLLDVTSGGPLWCLCRNGSHGDYTEFQVKVVTVMRAPIFNESLELENTNLTEGDTLTASCFAMYARPVAKIIWSLGGKVIRNDTQDDNADNPKIDIEPNNTNESRGDWPWRWPWNTKSIKQVLNHRLTLNDTGKKLICQVLHPALDGGQVVSTSSEITVNASPVSDYPNGTNISSVNSNALLVAGLLVGAVLAAIIVAGIIYCRRRKGGTATSAGHATDCTSFIEENNLYQGQDDCRFVNRHTQDGNAFEEENDLYQSPNDPSFTSGVRASIQAENPYDEINIVPCVNKPSTTTSPTYGNTVHYAEVAIGPNYGLKPPPKKPTESETCLYAQVMKPDQKPPPPKPVAPVYAQVMKKKPQKK